MYNNHITELSECIARNTKAKATSNTIAITDVQLAVYSFALQSGQYHFPLGFRLMPTQE